MMLMMLDRAGFACARPERHACKLACKSHACIVRLGFLVGVHLRPLRLLRWRDVDLGGLRQG